jgi:hypothetical protein
MMKDASAAECRAITGWFSQMKFRPSRSGRPQGSKACWAFCRPEYENVPPPAVLVSPITEKPSNGGTGYIIAVGQPGGH